MQPPERRREHGVAIARWTVTWLGWLWLGQQGLAAGVGGPAGTALVALWWALQAVGSAPLARGLSTRWLGVMTALAVVGAGVLPAEAARTCLWIAAVPWGLWCGRLRAQRPCRQAGRPWPWAPASAAVLAGLAVLGLDTGTWLVAALLLAGAAWLPSGHAAGQPAGAVATGAPGTPLTPASALAGMAMGLMMGSLWLSADWCSSFGAPQSLVVAAHLAVMALLPALLSTPASGRRLMESPWFDDLRLLLLACGGWVALVEPSPAGWMAAMALQALAWAAGVPSRQPQVTAVAPGLRRPLALAGPALLLAVGLASQGWGPQALAAGHALVGAAGIAALAWRRLVFFLPQRNAS